MSAADLYVAVAGLQVPAVLVPRIVAAMRGLYPTVTADLEDEDAVRAVLKWWVTSTLSTWESQQAAAPVADQLNAIQAAAEAKAKAAATKAQKDADSIIPAQPTDPPH